jgi:hypothetical protein
MRTKGKDLTEEIPKGCQRVKDFGLNVNFDTCGLKISQKTDDVENIHCINHEIKEVENFRYLRSKMVTNGSVKEKTEIKNEGKMLPFGEGHTMEIGNA